MITRLLVVVGCVGVVFSGVSAFGQYVVGSPAPVVVYRPAPVAVPLVPVYRPVVPAFAPVAVAPAPVVVYRPAFVPAPPPAVYGSPYGYFAPPAVVVHPKVYVSGQPVRNVLRAITP